MAQLSESAANSVLDTLIAAYAGDILIAPLRVSPSAAYLGSAAPTFAAASGGVKGLSAPVNVPVAANPGTVVAVDLRNTSGTMLVRALVGTGPDTAEFTAGVADAVVGQTIRFNAINLYMS
jgi:hypothetical protein